MTINRISGRTGWSAWRIPRLVVNFLSVSPHMLAQAEERLYQGNPSIASAQGTTCSPSDHLGLKNKYYGEHVHIR